MNSQPTTTHPLANLPALIAGAGESTVQVFGRARLPASGVVWSSEDDHAYLITANHVVEHGHPLRVAFADEEPIPAIIHGRDPRRDLALLQIPRLASAAHWAEDNRNPAVGEAALAIGRPFGELEASLGIIRAPAIPQREASAPDEEDSDSDSPAENHAEKADETDAFTIDPDAPWQETIDKLSRSAERAVKQAEEFARGAIRHWEIQSEREPRAGYSPRRHRRRRRHMARAIRYARSAPGGALPLDLTLYPGFSGGSLMRLDGRAIGILTSHFGEPHALPLPILRETVSALLAREPAPQSAFLGVSGQPVQLPAALAQESGQDAGLLLHSIQHGSAAEAAGVLLGDILISFNDAPLASLRDLRAALREARAGEEVRLRLVRAGEISDKRVTLGGR